VLITSKLPSGYFPELSGDVGEGEGGVGLLLFGPGVELLLPVLDSVPPGEVAEPVEAPAVIPKCE